MKKIASILKNKEIMSRIFFTLMILLVLRIGAAIRVPGVTPQPELANALSSANAVALMDLLGGGALSNFSIFALGVSPYITAQIIIELLAKDVLPALTELSKQGQYGRKKTEMATRYLTLMLGAVQAYGLIKTMQNSAYVTFKTEPQFWDYIYIVLVLLAGSMTTMWLGDQITEKGLGNGISVIIFAGIIRSLPIQIRGAFQTWIGTTYKEPNELILGSFRFALYILAFILILAFVTFIELAKRKIPVQHSGKSGGQTASMSKASFLPIKVNSAGVIPVIFASSLMMVPSVIASFFGADTTTTPWLKIFSYSEMVDMGGWQMPWGLIMYVVLIMAFSFFYATLQISPETLAENFRKNGSYIPGIRPGNETERYVKKVVNRVTCIGATALTFIAALPVILTLTGVFGENSSLAIGGTGLIIAVGVALEVMRQIDGLLAGKSFDEVQASAGRE